MIKKRPLTFSKMFQNFPLNYVLTSEALHKTEGTKKIKTTLFHQYLWNSKVETTWISLIGWPHKTSTIQYVCTVGPWAARPQAARTLKMHVFELGPKIFEMHVFARFLPFFDKWALEMHVFARFCTFLMNEYFRCTFLHVFCTFFNTWVLEIHDTPIK